MSIIKLCIILILVVNGILTLEITIAKDKCSDLCDLEGGICSENNICQCKEGYSSFPTDNFKFCNYKKYSKKISEFLELFIGFGAGHFYCLRKVNGFFKFQIFFIIYCLMCCIMATASKIDVETNDQNHTVFAFSILLTLCCCSFLLMWQLMDFILFFAGVYKDGNGFELQ